MGSGGVKDVRIPTPEPPEGYNPGMLVLGLLLTMGLQAQEILALPPPGYDHRVAYGTDPQQFGDLRLPVGKGVGPFPVLVVIHGGYWRARYPLDYAGHMSAALTPLGFAAWNIEYRRVSQPGGGYPGTLEDVRAAVLHVAKMAGRYGLDAKRVFAIGHSAGGHLALWLAAEGLVQGAIGLAAVTDLEEGWRRKLGNGAVADFMGCVLPECPESYRKASPAARLPVEVPVVLLHGTADTVVPADLAESYMRRAGSKAELVRLEGAGHFELVDPRTKEWKRVAAMAARFLKP